MDRGNGFRAAFKALVILRMRKQICNLYHTAEHYVGG